MNQALITFLSTVVASAIAGGVAILVARSSKKATTEVAATTTRSDIEKEAFERAEGYYQGVIEDQNRRDVARLADLHAAREDSADARRDAAAARSEAHTAHEASENCQAEIRELQQQVRHYRAIGRRLAKVVLDKQGNLDDPSVHEAVLTFIADGDDLPKK